MADDLCDNGVYAGYHIVNLCENPLKASWGDGVNPIWNLRLLERDG